MANGVHAIVIFYDGKTPTETDIALIGKTVDERLGVVGDEQILVYSSKELSNMVLTSAQTPMTVVSQGVIKEQKRTPEDYAIIYVGEMLKSDLKDYDYEKFVPMLTQRIVIAQQNMTEDSKKFLNALEILSKDTLEVSKNLLREYYFTPKILGVIKNVYTYFK